jgi:hypothetical protein
VQLPARGDPPAWLGNLLNVRGTRFVMSGDTIRYGSVCLRRIIQCGEREAHLTLTGAKPQDSAAWQCSRIGPTVPASGRTPPIDRRIC